MESTHDSRIAYWDHEPRSKVALIINGLRTQFDAWFPSSDGDRWRAPNIGDGTGGTMCSVASGG